MQLEKLERIAKGYVKFTVTDGFTETFFKECKKRNVSAFKDVNGNLIATIPGKTDYIVGLAAHCDTLGAMVKYINGDGTLKFSRLGSPILPTYDGEYCYIFTRDGKRFTGTFLSNSPAVHVYGDAKTLPRNEDTMHVRIDEEVKCKEDVLKFETSNKPTKK